MATDFGKQLDEAEAECMAWLEALSKPERDYLLGSLPANQFEREPKLEDEDNLLCMKANLEAAKDTIKKYRDENKGTNEAGPSTGVPAALKLPKGWATTPPADSEGRNLRKRKEPTLPSTKSTKSKSTKAKGKQKAAPIEIDEDELKESTDSELSTITSGSDTEDNFIPPEADGTRTSGNSGSSDEGESELIPDSDNEPSKKKAKKTPQKPKPATKAGTAQKTPIPFTPKQLPLKNVASPFNIGGSSSSIISPSPRGGSKSPTKPKHILSFTSLEATYNSAFMKWEQAQQREDHTWNGFERPEIIPHSEYPSLGPEIEPQAYRNTYMWFQCKSCHGRYKHRVGESSGGTLSDHKSRCKGKQAAKNAITHGISYNTNTMTESKFLFTAIVNTAVHNRSFNSINDLLIQELVQSLAVPFKIPQARTLSNHCRGFVAAVRETVFKRVQERMEGNLSMAVDGWSSPNHRSYLGIVISWLQRNHAEPSNPSKTVVVRSTVLDFIHSEGASTGQSMADQISHSLQNVNLGQNLFAITLDNASANDVLVQRLGKDQSLSIFTGEPKRVRCFAHILNLVVKSLLMPFTPQATVTALKEMVKRQEKAENRLEDDENVDGDERDMFNGMEDEISEADDEQENLELGKDQEEWEKWCQNEDPLDSSVQYADDLLLIDETVREGMNEAATESSLEGGASQLSSLVKQVKEVDLKAALRMMAKVCLLVKSTTYNKTARSVWQKVLQIETQAERYTGPQKFITRDVVTRWNSTGNMLRDVLDMKIIVQAFYAHKDISKDKTNKKRFVTAHRLNEQDFSLIQHLEKVLKFIKHATDYFQRETGQGEHPVTVAMVIPYIDQVTSLLDTLISNETAPIVVRTGASIASNLMNSYYSKTDESMIYRLAILLHPSMRMKHLSDKKWLPSWQSRAETLLRELYTTYQTVDDSPVAASSPADNWGPMMTVPDDEDGSQNDPVGEFIHGSRITGKNRGFVDPLNFWHFKMEDNYADLRRLALDVFSTPATSVAPERIFSSAGLTVSDRRHALGQVTLSSLVCLASWYKSGLISFEDWQEYYNQQ